MEDLDLSECSDNTFLPDFDGTDGDLPIMSGVDNLNSRGNGFDDRLMRAARKSESEGTLTPIVKEELRCFIVANRHKQGKLEIKPEFKEPEFYPLSQDEVRKKERRREQNRRAATKCRKKKKEAKMVKENEMTTLKNINHGLCKEVKALKRQVKQMSDVISEHEGSGQCCIASPPHSSFLNMSQMNQLDCTYQQEADVSEAMYSPHSPNSLFTNYTNNGIYNCASTDEYPAAGQMNCNVSGNIPAPLQLSGLHQSSITLNGTISLTPPVSPYMSEFPQIVDSQLSDVLRAVEYNAMLSD